MKTKRRAIILWIDATEDARIRDHSALVSVALAGVKMGELQYRHHSNALAACRRAARELKLVKLPRKYAWRSRV